MTIDRALVAGAGLMGHGIAQVLAATGRSVALYEPDIARAVAGRDRIAANLKRSVAKGRLTPTEREALLARIQPTDDQAAAADVDLVVEAIFEDVDAKTALWGALDRIAPPAAIFATNTSSIGIDRSRSFTHAQRPTRKRRR